MLNLNQQSDDKVLQLYKKGEPFMPPPPRLYFILSNEQNKIPLKKMYWRIYLEEEKNKSSSAYE